MSKLIRISDPSAQKLESLSELTGQSKQKLLDQAITLFAHEQILKKANEQYTLIKNDPQAWKELEDERKEWDITLADGLNDD